MFRHVSKRGFLLRAFQEIHAHEPCLAEAVANLMPDLGLFDTL